MELIPAGHTCAVLIEETENETCFSDPIYKKTSPVCIEHSKEEYDYCVDEMDNLSNRSEENFHHRRPLSCCVISRSCSFCTHMFSILMFLSSIVALIVFGIIIIVPYIKASRFKRATCVTAYTAQDLAGMTCACGKGCISHFPCIKLTVKIIQNMDAKNINTWTAKLSQDETEINRKVRNSYQLAPNGE